MNPLAQEIEILKRQKNAVILAHYYVRPEVQELADEVGDSYFLAERATKLPHSTIVLCGVSFMGESVKLLSPEKTVLLPEEKAGCPMAGMYSREKILQIRETHGDAAVVSYVNSTAELKSLSDTCVTSANAVKVVRALPHHTIYFLPDQNLGRYVASQVPEKAFILGDGHCYVHTGMEYADVKTLHARHPGARVLAHPECREAIVSKADFIGSTAGIVKYAAQCDAEEFIVCTETGILRELEMQAPGKLFLFPGDPVCMNMKKIRPESVLRALQTGEYGVEVDPRYAQGARAALEKMLELAARP